MPKGRAPREATPDKVTVRGRITQQLVHPGTASEREAWVLDSPSHGKLILKPLGGNPFRLGPAPASPGSQVEVSGYLSHPDLHYDSVKEL
jgi:hypothetical protein